MKNKATICPRCGKEVPIESILMRKVFSAISFLIIGIAISLAIIGGVLEIAFRIEFVDYIKMYQELPTYMPGQIAMLRGQGGYGDSIPLMISGAIVFVLGLVFLIVSKCLFPKSGRKGNGTKASDPDY